MTVGELKELLERVKNDLEIYHLEDDDNPLCEGEVIGRVLVITDTGESAHGVYLKRN